MSRISVSEFRQHLLSYLDRAGAGETIEITRHGATVACLSAPVDRSQEARARLLELRSEAVVGDVETPLDEPWDAER